MDVMDLCLLLALVVLGCWCVDSLLRAVDEDVLESPRTLQPLEAAGQPERRDPTAEVWSRAGSAAYSAIKARAEYINAVESWHNRAPRTARQPAASARSAREPRS